MRRFFYILLFLPLLSFGDFISDYLSTNGLVNVRAYRISGSSFTYAADILNSLPSFAEYHILHSELGIVGNPSSSSISTPIMTKPTSYVSQSQLVPFKIPNTNLSFGVSYFPALQRYVSLAFHLVSMGYRGSSVTIFTDTSSSLRFNVTISTLIEDCLFGTNNLYRAEVLSALSSVSSSLVSIDSGVSNLVPVVESVREVNVNILSNSVDIVSNTLDIIDALIGDYPEEGPTRGTKGAAKGPYNDVRTSIKSQLQAWRNQATSQLQSWKTDLADQLEAWKTSDETGYLNIRKKLEDNFETKPPSGSSNTNNLPYTAFVTNQVVKVITNVVERSVAEGSAQISTNVQREAASTRRMLQDDLITPLFDPNGSGVNVNIKAPLWGQSQSAVHVHDSALDTFGVSVGASLDDMNEWLGDIYSLGADADNNWAAWFDRWDNFSEWTISWYTDWWDLLADNMDSFYSAFYTADGTRRMMLELISNPEFRADVYQGLNWFQRVEYLLGFIANVSTGTVEVADIEDDLEAQGDEFIAAGTNLVSVSSDVVGLFDYVTRFSTSLRNAFQSSSAPVTEGITLLSGDSWFSADQPLVLRVDVNIQNALRLGCQCIWYLLAIVGIWLVVSWAWGKILAVCRWLWSMFDI